MSKPTYEELEHIACEMSQQDWNDLRFADVYYKAFVEGGKWFMRSHEQLEQQQNELAAQVKRLRNVLTRMVDEKAVTGAFYYKVHNELFDLAKSALSETPPAALAALKAQWQAEAIEQSVKSCRLKVFDGPDLYSDAVLYCASELRQRAQENSDGDAQMQ